MGSSWLAWARAGLGLGLGLGLGFGLELELASWLGLEQDDMGFS